MSDAEQRGSGAGGTEGAPTGPVGPRSGHQTDGDQPADDQPAEPDEVVEIPLGLPVSPAEMRRLKEAAERHRDEDEPSVQTDTTAQPDDG